MTGLCDSKAIMTFVIMIIEESLAHTQMNEGEYKRKVRKRGLSKKHSLSPATDSAAAVTHRRLKVTQKLGNGPGLSIGANT